MMYDAYFDLGIQRGFRARFVITKKQVEAPFSDWCG